MSHNPRRVGHLRIVKPPEFGRAAIKQTMPSCQLCHEGSIEGAERTIVRPLGRVAPGRPEAQLRVAYSSNSSPTRSFSRVASHWPETWG